MLKIDSATFSGSNLFFLPPCPMSNRFAASKLQPKTQPSGRSSPAWKTFSEILQGLHGDRIYLHPDQLAEFFVAHGLPVDLCYVPSHLKQKAQRINANYQGNMAQLETVEHDRTLLPFE